MRTRCGLGLALVVLLVGGNSARADFLIDHFETYQEVEASGPPSGTLQAIGVVSPGSADVLGGSRKMVVNRFSNNIGTVNANANGDDATKLDFATLGTTTTGDVTMIYDQTSTFLGTGNVGVSLTGTAYDVTEGGLDKGLNINGFADHPGVSLVATFYDVAGNTKTATINLTADPSDNYANYFTLFTDFTGTADLTKVVAFTATISATQGSTNVSLDYFATAPGPIGIRTVPEPASFVMVGMGMIGSGVVAVRSRRKRA